jgi:hypothetical protein
MITRTDLWATPIWHFDIPVGRVIIFPSWISHSVEPNQSSTDRISISFDFG